MESAITNHLRVNCPIHGDNANGIQFSEHSEILGLYCFRCYHVEITKSLTNFSITPNPDEQLLKTN